MCVWYFSTIPYRDPDMNETTSRGSGLLSRLDRWRHHPQRGAEVVISMTFFAWVEAGEMWEI